MPSLNCTIPLWCPLFRSGHPLLLVPLTVTYNTPRWDKFQSRFSPNSALEGRVQKRKMTDIIGISRRGIFRGGVARRRPHAGKRLRDPLPKIVCAPKLFLNLGSPLSRKSAFSFVRGGCLNFITPGDRRYSYRRPATLDGWVRPPLLHVAHAWQIIYR